MSPRHLDHLLRRVADAPATQLTGRIRDITGPIIRATVPGIAVGELATISRSGDSELLAEAVGFRGDHAVLMPLGDTRGVSLDSKVSALGHAHTMRCGTSLLGRVLNGLGEPIDGRPLETDLVDWNVDRPAPRPLSRRAIDETFPTGVRVIDGLMTVGRGQRLGLFAGSGVGKSSLLASIARNGDADVAVICLVGERGREVRDFVEVTLGDAGMARSIVVCATSDEPALVRLKAARVATSIAEWFRDQGSNVLLLVDSLSRVARAQREVGLAAGEPPTRRGYPPSVFSLLPRLVERSGTSALGTITAVYTVLVEGDDLDDPVADEVRGLLDGHVVLDRAMANRGIYPAVDVLASLSRLMPRLADEPHLEAAREFRQLLAAYESKRDFISLGAYRAGSDPLVDDAIELIEAMEQFINQPLNDRSNLLTSVVTLRAMVETS